MVEMDAQPAVKFCYQCGRRTDGKHQSCWYCGTSFLREIRPPRKCPFCGSQIPHDAIKCRHCGEFVDGRERATPAPAVQQQIIYVVDRSLLGGGTAGDYRLLPGQPVPPDVARRLSPPTVRAIEQNQPHLIDQPGVTMLPAPASGEVLDVEAQPMGGEPRKLLGTGSREVARPADSKNLPSRRQDTPQAMGSEGFLGKLGRWFLRTAPGRSKPRQDEIPEAKIEDRYRICENCKAEILASDNYCFHCGFQYHRTRADINRADRSPGVVAFYVVILALIAGIWASSVVTAPLPWYVKPALGGVSLILCAGCFFYRRSSLNQMITIALAIATAVVFLLF